MLSDDDLFATCIADEAGNQPYEGMVAVGCVVLNRMALKYESDGTMRGTVEKKFQFSGFWFAMEAGHYTEIEFDQAGAETEAQHLCDGFKAHGAVWSNAQHAAQDARTWRATGSAVGFKAGPQFGKLTDRTVLYLNPSIVHPLPAWATADKLDAVIFQHSFYHG